MEMLRHYLTVVWRNVNRHKLYTALTVSGLAAGLFACLLILLYVNDELSYDRFFTKPDDVYRIVITYDVPGREPIDLISTPAPTGPALKAAIPEIAHATRMIYQGETLLIGDKTHTSTITYVDPDFLNIFDFALAAGNPDTALREAGSLILTKSLAEEYFPDEPALGKTIRVREARSGTIETLTVTGVIDDLPANTHMSFKALAHIESASNSWPAKAYEGWIRANLLTYIRVAPGTAIETLETAVFRFNQTAIPDSDVMGMVLKGKDYAQLEAQRLTDIHLTSNRNGEIKPSGSMVTVLALTAVAFLILTIASINYMNLSTARATLRAREVSMRKVVGARRADLIVQFLGESVILTLIAFVLALAALEMALPLVNHALGKSLTVPYGSDPLLLVQMLGLAILVGVGGGLYPALVLSAFNPAAVFTGSHKLGSASDLRTLLVILQFSISIALMAATAIVVGQTFYAKTVNLGWQRDHLVVISGLGNPAIRDQREALRERLLDHPAIEDAAFSTMVPTENWDGNTMVRPAGHADRDPAVMHFRTVDLNFFNLYGIGRVAGQGFSPNAMAVWELPEDELETVQDWEYVISEMAAERLGFATPEAAIGQRVAIGIEESDISTGVIVGVVGDVHFNSIRDPIVPTLYFVDPRQFWKLSVRIDGGAEAQALAAIDEAWESLAPGHPIRRRSMDESVAALYEQEDRQGLLLASFSALAILVACLGLFGLASFAAERRTREIGIRKALGATTGDIVRLLLWQFSKPVLIANLIAWPAAFWLMDRWLDRFAYRIDLHAGYFLGASVLALIVAWATVAYQAGRVAWAKPAPALRYD